MKVVYLHQYFNTPAMSGGTRSWELGRRLVQSGHEVEVVTSDRQPAPGRSRWQITEEEGMRVHWFATPYSNALGRRARIQAFVRFAIAARRRARDLGGDLVFATSTPLTIALPAVYASRVNRIPMVFEVRDLWPEIPIAMGALRSPISRAAARWLRRHAYRHARAVVALSPGTKAGIVATGYPEDRVTVIPNAADIELFQGREAGGRRIRAEHPWLGDRPMVLYAGTLGRVNGVEYLARVAAAAQRMSSQVQFVVVGDGGEEEKVRSVARSAGVLDRNFHLLGRFPKQCIPDWFAAADIALSLVVDREILWANSANKFFDALAAGRPVAINHGGWQAEIIEAEACGLVLPPGDVDCAARRLVEVAADVEWVQRTGARALDLARSRFSREKLFETFEVVLRRAVGTP